MSGSLILAGDVGGTRARMAFFEVVAGPGGRPELRRIWSRTLASASFPGLEDVVREVLRDSGLRPAAASFGVAGPVVDGRCRTTNLPWEIDTAVIARAAGLEWAGLLNDLVASAWGLASLPSSALVTLHEGAGMADGPRALIAAGTGLGEAWLAWDGQRHVVGASEGGHCSFAPADDEQDELLRSLRARLGHVSWERLVSGPGLAVLADHLARMTGERLLPGWSPEDEDAPAAISGAAEDGHPLALRALRLFVTLYGAEAGNLALKILPTGGLFVGGGIAPRIRPFLEGPEFLAGFLHKGRMRPLLERIPVMLVLDDELAVTGAARHAATGC